MKNSTGSGSIAKSRTPLHRKYLCKPDADVEPGKSVTVTVWEGQPPVETSLKIENVWHNWMAGVKKISQGKECIIDLIHGVWRFTHAECE